MTDGDRERMAGRLNYIPMLKAVHELIAPRFYLEIGIRNGKSLSLARCPAIGIDPAPDLKLPLGPATRVVVETSDAYFAGAGRSLPAPIDLAFIDGMHLFEFALRDFINVEARAAAAGIVVFDDIFPNHPAQALRQRETRVWTGDVWRVIPTLLRHRPDLLLIAIDTYPTGLLLAIGLDPARRDLETVRDALAADPSAAADLPVPPGILGRRPARAPDDPRLLALLRDISEWRHLGLSVAEIAPRLTPHRAIGITAEDLA